MRLLVLLVSVLVLVVPRRRPAASPSRPAPSSLPLVSSPADPWPRRRLALAVASPSYRDGLGPAPESGRVRPYLVAAERRRAERVWQGLREELAEIARRVVEQPDPEPVPGPGPGPGPGPVPEPGPAPRLPRRRPGEHAPPEPEHCRPVPEPAASSAAAGAAWAGRPSPETLQLILSRLQELDSEATADAMAGATVGVGSVRSGGGW